LVLENDKIRAMILPEYGGKIASLYLKEKGFEAAAAPGEGKKYVKPVPDGSFTDFDMSGMDDAFPNIDAETITYEGRVLCYPDHGEIWSRGMEVISADENSVSLRLLSSRFRYDYKKTVSVYGNKLRLAYDIKSVNDAPLPCMWAFHCLMTYREDMEFTYPPGTERFINVLNGTPLGEEGRIYEAHGKEIDFSRLPVQSIAGYSGKPYYVKYYSTDRAMEGSCSIYYPSEDVRVGFRYDAEILPWLGVWINGGGFKGDKNTAMEMTNGYYDSVSRGLENNRICILNPGERVCFNIEISLDY